ncbi:MAG: hypothetical protein PWR13_1269 [Archaeoglobi archaeon]|nr:hypothetical protein [Archaeoglobi archaeon]
MIVRRTDRIIIAARNRARIAFQFEDLIFLSSLMKTF